MARVPLVRLCLLSAFSALVSSAGNFNRTPLSLHEIEDLPPAMGKYLIANTRLDLGCICPLHPRHVLGIPSQTLDGGEHLIERSLATVQ